MILQNGYIVLSSEMTAFERSWTLVNFYPASLSFSLGERKKKPTVIGGQGQACTGWMVQGLDVLFLEALFCDIVGMSIVVQRDTH